MTEVAAKWQKVATMLGVKKSIIDAEATNHPKDCEGACNAIFSRWLKGDRNTGEQERTWSTILSALGGAGYGDLEMTLWREHFMAE